MTDITEAIAQTAAEAARPVVQAMAVAGAENSPRQEGTLNVGPKIGRPRMKQPTLNWEAEDKYTELKNARLEVNNVFKSYNMPQTEKITIIKNWLCRKDLQLLETLTQSEHERCNTMEGLFTTLNSRFKLHIMKPSNHYNSTN